MKILLISYYYSFNDSTGSLRPRAMEKYLPQNGIEVAVLTYLAQNQAVTFNDNIVGVKNITRETVPLIVYYAWRIWQKMLRVLGFYRGELEYWRNTALQHADKIIDRVKPDAIVASYPSVEALDIGVSLSEKYGLPLISDFRDGLLFEPVEEERMRLSATRRYYESLEEKVVSVSNLVITVSEPISAYFRERYAHPNTITLHNGFDPDDIAPDMSVVLPSGYINVVHTGRLGISEKKRSIDVLCSAIKTLLIQSPDVAHKYIFHFVGKLSQEEQDSLSPLVNVGVVKLWGHQARAKSLAFQRMADILLLITAPDKASIATGKLFEYLAANKPILALTRGTEAARIIIETGAGLVVEPDRVSQIVEMLTELSALDVNVLQNKKSIKISSFSRVEQMRILAQTLAKISTRGN